MLNERPSAHRRPAARRSPPAELAIDIARRRVKPSPGAEVGRLTPTEFDILALPGAQCQTAWSPKRDD